MNEDSAICLEMVQIKQQLSGRQSIQAMLSILPTASRKRPTTERSQVPTFIPGRFRVPEVKYW